MEKKHLMAVWLSLIDPFSDYLHTPCLVLCCSHSCPVSRSLVFQLPSLHGPLILLSYNVPEWIKYVDGTGKMTYLWHCW